MGKRKVIGKGLPWKGIVQMSFRGRQRILKGAKGRDESMKKNKETKKIAYILSST